MQNSQLELIRDEIRRQPNYLNELGGRGIKAARIGSIFVGSGDSYIASLIAFYASSGRYLAMDPYSLFFSPEFAEDKDVYFVSISGKTRSNIELARKLLGIARSRIAITADEGSTLAREVDLTIKLPYELRKLPGTLSFTLSSLMVLKLIGARIGFDFNQIYNFAELRRDEILFSDQGTVYFLGNNISYPLAMYSAAKLYEFFGSDTKVQMLEQFSHMDLFSLKRLDAVNIFQLADPLNKGERLNDLLAENGYRSKIIKAKGSNTIEQLFYTIFLVQLSILDRAAFLNIREPYFVLSREKLGISNSMIY